jgi:excinuclease UvrABC nuclease subunit
MYQNNNFAFSGNAVQNKLTHLFLLLLFVYFSCFSVLNFIKDKSDLSAKLNLVEDLELNNEDLDDLIENNSSLQLTLKKHEQISALLYKNHVNPKTISEITTILKSQNINLKILKNSRVLLDLAVSQERPEFFDVINIAHTHYYHQKMPSTTQKMLQREYKNYGNE